MLKKLKVVVISSAMLASLFVATANAEPSANAQGYWDNDAMRNAKPIELRMDRKTGLAQLITPTAALPESSGAEWTDGGLPQTAVGKIFFTSGGSNYVCSGALVTDSNASKAIVLTAGHCAIDKGRFSTNFMFVPNYDSYVDSAGIVSVPNSAKWYASNLVVRTEFASARQFNTTAIQHDWAFAVIPTGTFTKDKKTFSNGLTAPDDKGNSFALSVGGFNADGNTSTAFGYPAASPYNGKYLIYAKGSISTDLSASTWGMPSLLTGGASGGPWLSVLTSDTYSAGSVSSLNSYKYTNDTTRMYGPKFGDKTTKTYDAALNASGSANVIVTG